MDFRFPNEGDTYLPQSQSLQADYEEGSTIITALRIIQRPIIQLVASNVPDAWVPVLPDSPAFEAYFSPMSVGSDHPNLVPPMG